MPLPFSSIKHVLQASLGRLRLATQGLILGLVIAVLGLLASSPVLAKVRPAAQAAAKGKAQPPKGSKAAKGVRPALKAKAAPRLRADAKPAARAVAAKSAAGGRVASGARGSVVRPQRGLLEGAPVAPPGASGAQGDRGDVPGLHRPDHT